MAFCEELQMVMEWTGFDTTLVLHHCQRVALQPLQELLFRMYYSKLAVGWSKTATALQYKGLLG